MGAGMAKDGDAAGGADSAASAPRPPRPPQPSVDIKLPPGAGADEVREAIEEARAEIKAALDEVRPRTRVIKGFSPGDYLPEFALLLILASIIVKVMGAGQRKAEARAAEAAEIAEGEALKRQVVEARMAAMQAQVEPHFLFNTLASIDHLIETDAARASRMQKNLIALLRASMPTMRETAASGAPRHLERELAVVRPYLEILKMRMEERLSVTIDVPDGLLSAEFPPMVMQSLVENAVKHGLEPKPEGGSLVVKAEIVHGKLAVTVADTGLGFGKAPATSGTGVGLANIRERLQLLYGSKATITISENRPSGTVVTVTVPVRRTYAGADMTRAVIADDERLMREQLRARLAEVWPELEIVAEAKNGEEAVALVEQHRPELVFLDIRMPGLSGVEAAKRIAQLPAAQLDAGAADDDWACEIVFITAYDQYAVEAFEQGVVDYVLKPAERERLAITVDRIRKRLAARSSAERRKRAATAAGAAPAGRADDGPAADLPALDTGQRRQHHPDDPGRGRAVLRQRREVHARADRQRRGADPQADQGAGRRARPAAVLANPPPCAGEHAAHRRRDARLARAAAGGGARARRTARGEPQLRGVVQGDVGAKAPGRGAPRTARGSTSVGSGERDGLDARLVSECVTPCSSAAPQVARAAS